MRAFVVLGLVFFHAKPTVSEMHLFCVEWDVKPQRKQSVTETIIAKWPTYSCRKFVNTKNPRH